MKHLTLFVAAALALVVAGCGGGGGNDNGNPDPVDTLGQPRIEAVVVVERTNLRNPSQYTDEELRDPQAVNPQDLIVPTVYGVQDLRNFQTNESYYFQLVAYSSETGKRVILPATFTTDDTEFVHGVVGNSGLFVASDVPTDEPVEIYAEYNGARYNASYEVNERQVRVVGTVVTHDTQSPLKGVTVEFYNEDGLLVGQSTSTYDGSFRASVPLGTRFVTVNSQLLSNDLRRSYVVNGFRYNAGDADCRTPIQFDALGTVVIDPIEIDTAAGPKPDPADGCTGGGGGGETL